MGGVFKTLAHMFKISSTFCVLAGSRVGICVAMCCMSMASDLANTGCVFLMFSNKQLKPMSSAISVSSGFCWFRVCSVIEGFSLLCRFCRITDFSIGFSSILFFGLLIK